MAKKKKQSDFLFFVLSVMLLYGFFYLFIEPRTKTADKYVGKQSPELQAYREEMVGITAKLKESKSSSVDTTIIESAEAEWLNDPYYDMVSYGELALTEAHIKADYLTQRDSFTYSGFLDAGARKLAIINDLEYEVGETLVLTTGMYVLENIFPTKVVIENKVNRESHVIQLRKMEE